MKVSLINLYLSLQDVKDESEHITLRVVGGVSVEELSNYVIILFITVSLRQVSTSFESRPMTDCDCFGYVLLV